jgi:hypothetical protein
MLAVRGSVDSLMLSAEQVVDRLKGLSFAEAAAKLGDFNSYDRSIALMVALISAPTSEDAVRVFLEWRNLCDAPWPARSVIANHLRHALREVTLSDFLEVPERAFYETLPALVPVWRGCQRGRERGLYWTTDRAVAERFASGQRCFNEMPTLARALITKPHIFAVFVDREESEIVLDPQRLRKLSSAPLDARSLKLIRANENSLLSQAQ